MQFVRNIRGEKELSARAYPLSIPARRVLVAIEGQCGISTLARKVRLGELERNLQELIRWNLIDVIEIGTVSRFDDAGIPVDAPLLEVLPERELAAAKRLAIRYLFEHLPTASHGLAFRIEAADSQEILLIALGQAQRDLFDALGREAAAHFYETIVAPIFFPE
jgi:hypothetical protein